MNRKGISPVIAVLLLVIIAVAAAILTYLWVLGYIGTVQRGGSTEALQERIKVEGVDLSGTRIVGVYVRNIGDVQVTVSAVYLIYPSGETYLLEDDPWPISPGSMRRISLDSRPSLSPGTTYVVKAVTASGTEATYTFTFRT